jgi:hypothetical protein
MSGRLIEDPHAPVLSNDAENARNIRDHGPVIGAAARAAARAAEHDAKQSVETEATQFIMGKITEIESNPTPPTYQEVADLFAEIQRMAKLMGYWRLSFSKDNKTMAPAYYKLADIIIHKWNAKDIMTHEEAVWITNQLQLMFVDQGVVPYRGLLEADERFGQRIKNAILLQQQHDKDVYKDLLRNINRVIAAAAATAAAAAAAAPVPVPVPVPVDPRLATLMRILETQRDMMSEGDYLAAMNALKSLYDKPKQGGFPRINKSKNSKKSKKSRKSRKSRRH